MELRCERATTMHFVVGKSVGTVLTRFSSSDAHRLISGLSSIPLVILSVVLTGMKSEKG